MGATCCMDQAPSTVQEMLRHVYLNSTGLQVVYGDPAEENLQGVVVYLSLSLMPIGPASNSIFRKAGAEITIQCQTEAATRGGVKYGEVLVVHCSRLFCKHLICVICSEDPEEALAALHDSLISALTIASFKGIDTVAVPVHTLKTSVLSAEKQVELYFFTVQRFVSLHGDFSLIRMITHDASVANVCGQEFSRCFPPRCRFRTANLKKSYQPVVL